MITKNKMGSLLGILLITLFPLIGGVFSDDNIVHAQTNVGNPVQVYFNDFDGGAIVAPGVTATLGGVASLESVQGYDGYGFGGNFLRNGTGGYDDGGIGTPGSPTSLTLVGLPPHTGIEINFLLAIMDSWDGSAPGEGEGACTDCHPDILTIMVDGTPIFSEAFGYNGPVFDPPTDVLLAKDAPLGFNPDFGDAAYDMGLDPAFNGIPHSASTLTIEWFASGEGWQGGDDESWAIENLEIVVSEVPTLNIEINHNWVAGDNWPEGNYVTMTIDDPDTPDPIDFTDTQKVELSGSDTRVRFYNDFDIKPGHIVTLTDGETTKTHTALDIRMTKVDYTENTIEGYAAPGTELQVYACDDGFSLKADGNGYWIAYFTCALNTVSRAHVQQFGINETLSTTFFWKPSTIQVDISMDWVEGYDWLPDTAVSLIIDDPDVPGAENYTDTKIVAADDSVAFDFPGVYFVEPGHIVTLTDGGITEIYEVEYLDVYEVNPETDVIKGKAEPGKELEITVGGSYWISLPVYSDAVTGEWEVDFTGIADITPGLWGKVRSTTSWDENHTQFTWQAPIPTTYEIGFGWQTLKAYTQDEIVLRTGWGACTSGLVKAFQKDAHIDVTINGEPLYPEGDEGLYWGAIEPIELVGCKAAPNGNQASVSPWRYTLSPLEPGIYEVYVHYWLANPIVDGGDWDGDGKMDKFEGTLVENTITIVVK